MSPGTAIDQLLEARAAYERGWVLTPLRGKKPINTGWTEAPRPSLDLVESWADAGNLGVRTGAISGVMVLDDDTADCSGVASLHLPPTVTVETGGGGRHYYFKCTDPVIGNSSTGLPEHVDVRANGGQAVLPGSVHHETGSVYRWLPGHSPDEVEVADLPEALLERLRPQPRPARQGLPPVAAPAATLPQRYAAGVLTHATDRVAAALEGARNDTLNKAAFTVGQYVAAGLLDADEAQRVLAESGRAAGLPDSEVAKTVKSGFDAGLENPVDLGELLRRLAAPLGTNGHSAPTMSAPRAPSDMGNAERLVAAHGQDLRYCHPQKRWYAWDGRRWRLDDMGTVVDRAKRTVRTILSEAAGIADDNRRTELTKWAMRSEQKERVKAMVDLARSALPVLPTDLDRHAFMLNTESGTLDLESCELRLADRADRITKLCPTRFDAEASCTTWVQFLKRVLPDPETRAYLQRALGYTATGDVGEQVMFFCLGNGANGKSTFLRVIQDTLGRDYAFQAAPKVLLATKQDRHPTELADFAGRRMAVCTELPAGSKFNEVLIKQLTGGDLISARRMHQDHWEFDPTHKIWIAANHKPLVEGTDDAIWRRMHLIPFNVQIPDRDRDRNLLSKLRRESPGILAWIVAGCRAWREKGLDPPAQVLEAVGGYREEMDSVGRFLEERCEPRPGHRIFVSEVRDAFSVWCEQEGEEPLGPKAFGLRMAAKGHSSRRSTGGQKAYFGLALRQIEPEVSEASERG